MTGHLRGIVVDGGGTRTRVRLVGRDGTTVAEAVAGPSNLTYGVDLAWQAIEAATRRAGLRLEDASALPMVAAMAGSREPAVREAFLAKSRHRGAVRTVSDGYAAHLGALGGAPGTVAAIGTGVCVLRLDEGADLRSVDGWGFPVGDEGGGWWIGMQAVRRLLHERDGRAPSSAFGSSLWHALRITEGNDDALRAWLRTATATSYASVAAVVVTATAAGDAIARDLLHRAASRIEAAVRAVDLPTPAPAVALLGGLSVHLGARLQGRLGERLVPALGTQLDGAARLLDLPFDEPYR